MVRMGLNRQKQGQTEKQQKQKKCFVSNNKIDDLLHSCLLFYQDAFKLTKVF